MFIIIHEVVGIKEINFVVSTTVIYPFVTINQGCDFTPPSPQVYGVRKAAPSRHATAGILSLIVHVVRLFNSF